MKLRDLINVLEGRENLELHIDGRQLHFTARNAQPEWLVREIESVRVNPQIYLGLTIRIKDEGKSEI